MSDLFDIMVFLSSIMAGLFNSLDSVMWGDISVLDLFIALIFIDGFFWFIFKMLGQSPAPIEYDDADFTLASAEDLGYQEDLRQHEHQQQREHMYDPVSELGHRQHEKREAESAERIRQIRTIGD